MTETYLDEAQAEINRLKSEYSILARKIEKAECNYRHKLMRECACKNLFLTENWLKIVNAFSKDRYKVVAINGINQSIIRIPPKITVTDYGDCYRYAIEVSDTTGKFTFYAPIDNDGGGSKLRDYVDIFIHKTLYPMYEEWACNNVDRLDKEFGEGEDL